MQTQKGILTETVIDLLKSGKSVELPATGYSMFPAFRPGDVVIVSPFRGNPEPGSVVVALKKDEEKAAVLVMHRLVEIGTDAKGDSLFITRGDSRKEADEPWCREQLIGIAERRKRGSSVRKVKKLIPGHLRYRFNYILLWLYAKAGG